jgi:hypothetical protein
MLVIGEWQKLDRKPLEIMDVGASSFSAFSVFVRYDGPCIGRGISSAVPAENADLLCTTFGGIG